jgi:uncharacterized protein
MEVAAPRAPRHAGEPLPDTPGPRGGHPVGRVRIDELGVDQCLARLRTVRLGRVGVSVGALPAILPVSFALVDEGIVFRTAPGSKLRAAVAGNVVAFEADEADVGRGVAWSVLVVGQACEVDDPVLLDRLRALGLDHWSPDGRDHVVLVRAEHVTGRLVTRCTPPDPSATADRAPDRAGPAQHAAMEGGRTG